jgi:hypothetical protein
LWGWVDCEELNDPVGSPAARHAEVTATIGRFGQVAAKVAVEVEIDESAATGAVACPVPMVGAGHSSHAARSLLHAAVVVQVLKG